MCPAGTMEVPACDPNMMCTEIIECGMRLICQDIIF
jgi:hypothetical protein